MAGVVVVAVMEDIVVPAEVIEVVDGAYGDGLLHIPHQWYEYRHCVICMRLGSVGCE